MSNETIEQSAIKLISKYSPWLKENLLIEEHLYEFDDVAGLIELAIAEEREANGWRDIETAPKDGETAFLGYQLIHKGLWVIAPMYFAESKWLLMSFHTDNTEHEMNPTHWMPIPDAPKDEVSE